MGRNEEATSLSDMKVSLAVLRLASDSLAQEFAKVLSSQVKACLDKQGYCNVMLTGGRSAGQLYAAWALDSDFQRLTRVGFYFGDERCVPRDDPDSNYGLAMRTLFSSGVPRGCTVHRMEADSDNLEAAADRYDVVLPMYIDLLLLSVGEDGHIASLFPHSAALQETRRRVVAVTGPKPPHTRLTITRPIIEKAKQIFVFACGDNKREILDQLNDQPEDHCSIPARIALRGIWVTEA